MKTILRLSITFFIFSPLNPAAIAQSDPIMRESLAKQGIPGPAFEQERRPQEQRQKQEQSAKQEREQDQFTISQKQVEGLQNKVQALQRQVDRLKKDQRQRQQTASSEESQNKITRVVVGDGLRDAKERGKIGRYAIMEGTTTAQAYQLAQTPTEKEVPALQVCATLADVNRMNKEDFVFMGFDEQVAEEILEARRLLGNFSSSKQITAVEGVEPEAFDKVRESVIAIEAQRLSE